MKLSRPWLACSGSVALALALLPVNAPAATAGIAYDSVTKFSMGDGSVAPQPGSFAVDYQAAVDVKDNSDDAPRGPFGLGKMLAKAQGAMAMFKNGTAEQHYVAGSKERTDMPTLGRATIVDCTARTLTTMDLKKKTYAVVSLDDVPSVPSGPKHKDRSQPAQDDNSTVALAVTNRALGPKQVEGQATSGYDSAVKMTVTRSTGEAQTFDMNMTAYYSGLNQPVGCSARHAAAVAGPAAASMGSYFLAMRALRTPKGDPRFTVTSAGPAMPTGKLAMFEVVAMGDRGALKVVTERGNVRSITDASPLFSVPADFTKVDAIL